MKLAATTLVFLALAPGAGAARAPDLAGPAATGAPPPDSRQEAPSARQYHWAAEAIFVSRGQYHAFRGASKTRAQRGSSRRADPVHAISRAADSAVSISSYAEARNSRQSPRNDVSNCPQITIAISVQNCSSKSARIAARGRYQSRRIQDQVERVPPARPESAVVRRDMRLMLQIGGLLGLVYGAFLALWLWATRLRPRMRRDARV